MKKLLKTAIASVLALCAVQASAQSRDMMKMDIPSEADLARVSLPDTSRVQGLGAFSPVVKTKSSCSALDLVRYQGEAPPDAMVQPLAVSPNIALEELLMQILVVNRIPLQPYVSGELRNIRATSALMGIAGGGHLADVLEELSKALGFFYRIEKGRLIVTPTRDFELSLPPNSAYVGNFEALLKDGFKATDVYIEKRTGRAFFTANRKVAERIQKHIATWPDDLAMIYLDVSVFQVSLRDGDSMGVNWEKFSYSKGNRSFNLTGGGSAVEGAMKAAFGLTLGSGVQISSVVEFLGEQGSLKLVQQPKLTVRSGEEALLDATTTHRYILTSQQALTSNGNTSGTVGTTMTEKELPLGLKAKVRPTYRNGMVFATVNLVLNDLENSSFQEVDGNRVPLYDTKDVKAETEIQAKDGEMVVISGIVTERTTQGLKSINLPIIGKIFEVQRSNSKERAEWVIILRPRVQRYIPDQTSCD